MEALSSAVAANRALVSLDLRNNRISGSSCAHICDVIRLSSLQTLDLRWNELDLNCARGLVAALKSCSTLMRLEVAGNCFDESVSRCIEETIRRNMKENLIGRELMRRVVSPVKTLPEFPLAEIEFEPDRKIPQYLTRYDTETIEKERVEMKLNDAERQLGEERERNMEIREALLKAAEAEKKARFGAKW